MSIKNNMCNSIKMDYEKDKELHDSFDEIRKLYDHMDKTQYSLDDQTFKDLDLSSVFQKIDKSYSSPGQASLYSLLRNTIVDTDELNRRGSILDFFQSNEDKKLHLHNIFYNLGYDNKNSLLQLLKSYIQVNKLKYFLYTALGKIIPLAIVILFVLTKNPKLILVLAASLLVNGLINYYEEKHVSDKGLSYLRKILITSRKIVNLNYTELDTYNNKIKSILSEIKPIDYGLRFLDLNNSLGGIFESISLPFLLSESMYYKISDKIKGNENLILELYYLLGEIEALISVCSYKQNLNSDYCKPVFVDDITLDIKEGVHPLIEKPVSNSIKIDKHGIVLTGTNMSGKSTFLRMVGTNIVFSQSFNFALAKEYTACLFNIVSSISPSDDVNSGKSYYMAEAESLLRIINATDEPIPVFCAIDEIFRGTNPIERIAASAEILKYINSKGAICIVATHDRELTNILEDSYDFFYFSESVDNSKGLSFDYKLKPGISQSRNAIKLLDYIGYPKEIINCSYERAKSIEGFI